MATPPADLLVGRRWELAEIGRALDRARAGRGQVLLLSGEPGIGKTRLLREAVVAARATGMRTVTATCWEDADTPAYWPWMQVVRALHGVGADAVADAVADTRTLSVLVPELSAEPPPALSDDHGAARMRLFDAVAALLAGAARPAGLFVAVEDAHWADEASLLLLRHVASALDDQPVVLAATLRDAEVAGDDRRAPIFAALARTGSSLSLPLGGLPAGDLAELIEAVLPGDAAPAWVESLAASTGGNPYFALELLRLHASQGGRTSDPLVAVPQTVVSVIERRVARLPQPVTEVLQLAAVAGDRFTVADLLAARIDEGLVVTALDLAASAGLVKEFPDGLGFCHALARQALYEHLGPVARARLHLRFAEALEGRGSAELLARHFLAAAPLIGPERGVHHAVGAGEHALAQFAHEEALVWFDRALLAATADGAGGAGPVAATADAQLRHDLASAHLGRAEARRRAGITEGAGADLAVALTEARALGDPRLLAHIALVTHRLGSRSGHVATDAIERLEEAAAAVPAGEPDLRAQVLAALAVQLSYHALDRWPEARERSAEALALAERTGDPHTLARCLQGRYTVLWSPDHSAERAAIAARMRAAARRSGDAELEASAVLLEATARLELADPAALGLLEEFFALVTRLHVPRLDFMVLSRRASLAILRGELDEADGFIADATVLGRRIGEPDLRAVVACLEWERTRFTGRQDLDAEGILPDAGAIAKLFALVWQPLIHLDAGRTAEAAAAFARPAAIDLAEVRRDWVFLSDVADLAEGAMRLGHLDAVARCYDAMAPYAGQVVVYSALVACGGAVDYHLGRQALALGRSEVAASHLERAAAIHEALGARLWLEATRDLLASVASPGAAGSLVRDGAVWRFLWRGEECQVVDVKGVHDLAVLLERPGQEVAASELYGGVVASTRGDDALDGAAKDAYRRRLLRLDAEREDARAAGDAPRLDAAERERDFILDELRRSFDLRGRPRRMGDQGERARKAVTARIRNAVDRIEACHPGLGGHLRASVQTGSYCAYRPPSATRWEVHR